MRDPDGKIWESSYIKGVFNAAQRDIQHSTHVLEGVQIVSVPSRYQYSYLYDWEHGYLPTNQKAYYQAFRYSHQGRYVFQNLWEKQVRIGATGIQAENGNHYTHPWEAWAGIPAVNPPVRFPSSFDQAKFIAFDKEQINYIDKKSVQESDQSWESRSGEPFAYYRTDITENEFVLYPRNNSITWSDSDGEGAITSIAGDTVSDDTGTVVNRTATYFDQDEGIGVTFLNPTNQIFLVSEDIPADIVDDQDESDLHNFIAKYAECGALERAYGANTDGKIRSLEAYWSERFAVGMQMIERFKKNRKSDRVYQLQSDRCPQTRRHRHPRLPDTYPPVNP